MKTYDHHTPALNLSSRILAVIDRDGTAAVLRGLEAAGIDAARAVSTATDTGASHPSPHDERWAARRALTCGSCSPKTINCLGRRCTHRLVTVGTRQSRVLWLPLNSRFAETRWLADEGRTMVVGWQAPRQHHPVLRKLVFTRLASRAE